MSQVTRAASKLKFETGDVPTGDDYADLHDSVVWYDEGGTLTYKKVDVDNYIILPTDYVLSVNNAGNNWGIVLPDPTSITGKTYVIKRYDNTSTGFIIVSSAVGLVQTPNGDFQATASILAWGFYSDKIMYMSNGTNWEYIH